jgi:hypothetical protein
LNRNQVEEVWLMFNFNDPGYVVVAMLVRCAEGYQMIVCKIMTIC